MHTLMPPQAASAVFDEPNLIGCGGLEPVVRLAERCGLRRLVDQLVTFKASVNGAGARAPAKVLTLVAGMVAGADSIQDTDRLRHGAMGKVYGGVRAPSTLGTFLRAFTHGHVSQLHAVARRLLGELARRTPLLPGADQAAYVDIDDTVRRTYGYAKQGAGFGYNKVKGINALLGIVSTPLSAPVIAATRLRKGACASVRGAASFVAETIRAARSCGASGWLTVRADSAFYTAEVIAACRSLGARFSITARMNASVRAAISTIDEAAWVTICYPQAVWDEDGQCWISQAQVAEIPYTAFTSKPARQQVTARLIVRRVRRLNDTTTAAGQGELFAAWRYHAVFTDSPLGLIEAEADHRRHAIIEQVIADVKGSALAHLPSGRFAANAAWLTLAAIAHNLTRAAGCLASLFHAKATTATIRAHLINVPVRLARSARRQTHHLPEHWPWQQAFDNLFDALHPTQVA
jgi:Transposase DDE domain group 1